MEKDIIIALAPTGGWGEGKNNPVRPEAVAGDVIACARLGAALVHLHARDARGRLTADLSCFDATVAAIAGACDILIEASTGGLSGLSAEERALPAAHPRADMASLNMGSLNFGDHVYRNALPDVRLWIGKMAAAGVKPSLEVFDTGHMETALDLIESGQVALPANFSFIFDVRWGMPYHPRLLEYLVSRVPPGCRWGALFVGSRDFSRHLAAAQMGAAFVRAGFEDSAVLEGRTAENNAQLVAALRTALEGRGFSIATPARARETLLGKPLGVSAV